MNSEIPSNKDKDAQEDLSKFSPSVANGYKRTYEQMVVGKYYELFFFLSYNYNYIL